MKPLLFFQRHPMLIVATLQVVLVACVVLLWPKIFGLGQRLGNLLSSYLF